MHEALGREFVEEGFQLTAGEHLVRAAIYYHFAKFVFVQDLAQMRAAHMKAVALLQGRAAPDASAGRVRRDSVRGQEAEGRAAKDLRRGPQPVLVMAPGLDSTKEEIHAYEEPFLARGIAVLAIDGPGQGEAEYEIPICGDYERAGDGGGGLDPSTGRIWISEKIAIWGVSLGGYYAPRAAAYEKRFKACIALSGPFDWALIWDALPDLTRETFQVRSHSKTAADAQGKRSETHVAGSRAEHHLSRCSSSPADRTAWCRPRTPRCSRRARRARWSC